MQSIFNFIVSLDLWIQVPLVVTVVVLACAVVAVGYLWVLDLPWPGRNKQVQPSAAPQTSGIKVVSSSDPN